MYISNVKGLIAILYLHSCRSKHQKINSQLRMPSCNPTLVFEQKHPRNQSTFCRFCVCSLNVQRHGQERRCSRVQQIELKSVMCNTSTKLMKMLSTGNLDETLSGSQDFMHFDFFLFALNLQSVVFILLKLYGYPSVAHLYSAAFGILFLSYLRISAINHWELLDFQYLAANMFEILKLFVILRSVCYNFLNIFIFDKKASFSKYIFI